MDCAAHSVAARCSLPLSCCGIFEFAAAANIQVSSQNPWHCEWSPNRIRIILDNVMSNSCKIVMEFTFIRDLKVGVKNVNLQFVVLEVGRPSTTKEGHEIRTCKVADRSACIHLSVWDDIGSYIQPGDICRLTRGYVSLWKGVPTLYVGKGGELVKTGEFCFIFNETINMSDPAVQQNAQAQQLKPDDPASITSPTD